MAIIFDVGLRGWVDVTGSNGEPPPFVPTSFADLRRDTDPHREAPRLVPADEGDMHALTTQGDFMRRSGRLAAGGAALGLVLILAAYAQPLLRTFQAFGTAGQSAGEVASEQITKARSAAEGVANQAAFVKSTDEKAINTAKGGLDCLTGKASCPNAASSPFR